MLAASRPRGPSPLRRRLERGQGARGSRRRRPGRAPCGVTEAVSVTGFRYRSVMAPSALIYGSSFLAKRRSVSVARLTVADMTSPLQSTPTRWEPEIQGRTRRLGARWIAHDKIFVDDLFHPALGLRYEQLTQTFGGLQIGDRSLLGANWSAEAANELARFVHAVI